MKIHINPERLLKIAIGIIAVLGICYLVTRYLALNVVEHPDLLRTLDVFNLDREVSLPTWFSQMLLFLAGIVGLAIGKHRRDAQLGDHRHWFFIGALLIYMSVDEGASIHELAADPMRRLLRSEGTWLQNAWVVVGAAVVLVIVLILVRFWLRLPKRTRNLLFVAAALYVIGAVGFEIVGGYVAVNISMGMKLALAIFAEESLEMLGAAIAGNSLLQYLRELTHTVDVSFISHIKSVSGSASPHES